MHCNKQHSCKVHILWDTNLLCKAAGFLWASWDYEDNKSFQALSHMFESKMPLLWTNNSCVLAALDRFWIKQQSTVAGHWVAYICYVRGGKHAKDFVLFISVIKWQTVQDVHHLSLYDCWDRSHTLPTSNSKWPQTGWRKWMDGHQL